MACTADMPQRRWFSFACPTEVHDRVDAVARELGLSRSEVARLVLGRLTVDDIPDATRRAIAELQVARRAV